MGKKIDLKGQNFGYLTVLEETSKRNASGAVIWKCKCKCGKETYANSTDLRSGHKKSCGCLQKELAAKTGHNNLKDITGQKFGLLTVLNYEKNKYTNNGSSKAMWKCQCDCGNIVVVEGNALKQGNTRSCGCIVSFGEQKIMSILNENNIEFVKQKTFPECSYRYDFYVQDKYIIEYDGKQHYEDTYWGTKESQQEKDKLKNIYCFQNNIPIIRIPYTHYFNLELKDLLLETSNYIVSNN